MRMIPRPRSAAGEGGACVASVAGAAAVVAWGTPITGASDDRDTRTRREVLEGAGGRPHHAARTRRTGRRPRASDDRAVRGPALADLVLHLGRQRTGH